MITSVCERKSVLKRPYAADHSMDYGKEQVMVANVDDVFIVSSLNEIEGVGSLVTLFIE